MGQSYLKKRIMFVCMYACTGYKKIHTMLKLFYSSTSVHIVNSGPQLFLSLITGFIRNAQDQMKTKFVSFHPILKHFAS